MKKLLSVLLVLILSLVLVGCNSPTDELPTDYYSQEEIDSIVLEIEGYVTALELNEDLQEQAIADLQDQIAILEGMLIDLSLKVDTSLSEIDLLKERINGVENDFANLGYFDGLNGQRSYYTTATSGMTNLGMLSLATELDKTKLPDYLFDIDGNRIDFDDLGELLKIKYFGVVPSENDAYFVGARTQLRFDLGTDIVLEEALAILQCMLEELRTYDYWLIGGSELMVTLIINGEMNIIQVYMPSFRSDGFNLDLEDIHYNSWEVYTTFEFDLVIAQAHYEQYVADETFIGYVLDYK